MSKSVTSSPAEELMRARANVVRITSIKEKGRSCRAIVICPKCMTEQDAAACSDVGGVWIYCKNCGMIDL